MQLFTIYIELLMYFRRKITSSFLTEMDLTYLKEMIVSFQAFRIYMFGVYQYLRVSTKSGTFPTIQLIP